MCSVEYLSSKKSDRHHQRIEDPPVTVPNRFEVFLNRRYGDQQILVLSCQTAIATATCFNADVALVSCLGLNENGSATDTSLPENELRFAMLRRAKRKVLLIDSSKINNGFCTNLCYISHFDDVVCDQPLPDHIMESVRNFHLVKP